MQLKWALLLMVASLQASAATTFISQSGGTFVGGSACNGQSTTSIATFNSGSQSAGQTYEFCGTITTTVILNGSGSAGNVITYLWDTGARISQAVAQGIYLGGNLSYLLFDGGIPCGPGTNCNTVEAANQTGYATGQTGIIEATANGSGLANQSPTSQAFFGCTTGCHDIEVKNLILRNLYQHTSLSDVTSDVDGGTIAFSCTTCGAGILSFHDSTIHDNGVGVNLSTSSSTTLNVYNNDFYHNNWAASPNGSGTRTVNFHDNHIHDTANWDTTADDFHHNGIHVFMTTAADSTAINIYNNLSDGDWGNCCTTTLQIFIDTGGFSTPNNINAYNNVCLQHSGNTAPCWDFSATTGMFVNNTSIGQGSGVALNTAGTNLRIENNVITGWQQYVVVVAGSTFTAFDYNTYGTFVASGNSPWAYGASMPTTFSAWKTACSCDSHGQQNNALLLNSNGTVQAGSPVIGAALNLTSLGITPLDSDYAGIARPASAAWDSGAYQFGSGITGGAEFYGVSKGVFQ